MKGFIVDSSHTIIDNQTHVILIGRLENGQSFMTCSELNPYCFIAENDLKLFKKVLSKYKIEKTDLKTFEEKKVVKISSNLQSDIIKLSNFIHKSKVNTYEADIKPHMRFIIDNNILGSIEIEGHYEPSDKIDRIYKNPEIKSASFTPELKIASIDLESDKKTGNLFCIGIYSDKYKENFMITSKKLKNTVSCKNESECLEKFKQALIKIDPDIITGWNIIDFDLKYLENLFKKNKIMFDLGRDDKNTKLRIESNFFRFSSAEVSGRQVLDGLNLIRDPFIKEAPFIKSKEFESYSLEDVAQAILGKGKILKGKERHEEITRLYKEDQQKLADYNLMDCELAYKIVKDSKMIDLAIERSQLTGLTLDRLTSSIASFDSVYIREARKKGLVSPSTRYGVKEERIKGGYVYSSKSGIYNNVLILDFKSLYPSIIRTFNIDPASKLNKKEKGCIESPNKAYFKNQEGVLPIIIEKLHDAREKAKKEKRELASYAIKIIMNSFFGVLASPNCRYFSLETANAITYFGQEIIKLTAKEIEKKSHKVIYSDTDSVFVETGLGKEKANKLGKQIPEEINEFYNKYVKNNFNRKSYLELEFDKQYLRLMIPKVRGSEEDIAAKKRYAGLHEENGKEILEIVGLEAIRGDWTEAAQEFQTELIKKTFHKEPIEKFIKSFVQSILSGKLDEKLIYRKSIRKNLDEYTKTTPPHVKAARKLVNLDSNIIQYYITLDGPEPIQNLRHKIDYGHYIEKQIQPVANQVLNLLNKKFEDIVKNSKQTTLF